jgi:hypothetical protein
MDFVMHRGRRGLGYLSIYKRLVLVGKVSADQPPPRARTRDIDA